MGLTIAEKILAAHAGKAAVEPGKFIIARPDMVMGNDLSTAGGTLAKSFRCPATVTGWCSSLGPPSAPGPTVGDNGRHSVG